MNRVLRKRILRDLKSNFMRYLALGMLIIMGMYLVVSMVGAAETVITGSEQRAEKNLVEDGQFSVFLPLTESQENELTDSGLTLEKLFSMDVELADDSVLRLMRNREKVDLIDLDNGRLAKKKGTVKNMIYRLVIQFLLQKPILSLPELAVRLIMICPQENFRTLLLTAVFLERHL